MKKQLLSTSAIALGVLAAAPAAAQDWDVRFSGFQSAAVIAREVSGTANTGADLDGVDVFLSGEIAFVPSVTMDNGLTFGVNVQLESSSFNGGDRIDESYLFVSGDFGTLTLGSENSEGYAAMAGVAWALQGGNLFINSPSVSSVVPFTGLLPTGFRTAIISTITEVGGNNDAERISYRTPDFNGFQAGFSYARDPNQDDFSAPVDLDGVGQLGDIFDIGLRYSGEFGGTSVNLAARWGTGDVQGGTTAPDFAVDPDTGVIVDDGSSVVQGGTAETWGVAANIGFGAVNFVASYAENDNPGTSSDTSGYAVGVGFDVEGPWAFALDTFFGESDETGNQAEYEAYKLNATRSIGTGASLEIFVVHVDAQDSTGADTSDGTGVGAMLNLWF